MAWSISSWKSSLRRNYLEFDFLRVCYYSLSLRGDFITFEYSRYVETGTSTSGTLFNCITGFSSTIFSLFSLTYTLGAALVTSDTADKPLDCNSYCSSSNSVFLLGTNTSLAFAGLNLRI